MNFRKTSLAVVLFVCCARVHASDILINPGFELDGTGTAVAGWTTFGPNVYSQNSGFIAHSGSDYLKVYQAFNGATNFTGVYQDNISGAGATYTADGWGYTLSTDALAGRNAAWVEVSFRDAQANVLALYRSAIITTNAISTGAFPKSTWIDLPVTNQYDPTALTITNQTATLIAPAGTSYVRYQITFQGDAANSAGSVYFDDLTLTQTSGGKQGNWNIVWSDEFNGTTINPSAWTFESGNNNGWGNNELEYYTSSAQNAYVSNGFLHIVALKQSMNGYNYTSARMKTQGLYTATYGRFEWRASLPAGVGFWPALWMMGENISTIGWPNCGEIDVTENNGIALTNVQGSLHSGSDETQIYTLPGGNVTNFHTYLLEWTTNAISWYVDGERYETQTNWSDAGGTYPFPFNQPFFLLMNLAVGGNYVGNPSTNAINAGANFPGQMTVDYVRLYNLTAPLQLSLGPLGTNLALSWPQNIICHLESATDLANWTNVSGAFPPYAIHAQTNEAFYRLVSP
jgi:beta-glucanase (GH16 family)